MKLWKYLVLALCLAALLPAALAEGDVAINEANFPDAAFRKIVKSYDKDYNDVLDAQEIGSVTRIDCYNASIASLKGVEVFTALRELNCLGNALTTLDVSKNVRLTTLTCSFNALTALDVSANVALTGLRCGNNQLTSLDLSRNTALTLVSCESNLLKSLDVSRNGRLSSLMCSENQLTALDVSSNAALAYLYCGQNQLTALDVTQNAALQTLLCDRNQLESLDLSGNKRLENWSVDPGALYADITGGAVALSRLPDVDSARITSVTGGKLSDGTLVPNSGAEKLSYVYSCGVRDVGGADIVMKCKVNLIYGEVGRFELPKQLRRVESGAFAKVNAAEFTLPANLETIAPDAFPAGARLYYPEGSVTARWFEENPGVYPLAEPYIP